MNRLASTGLVPALALCVAVLGGCKSTQEAAPALSGEQLAEAKSKWTGTWSGAWGQDGSCASTVAISEVTGHRAKAKYSWGGGCGGAVPSSYTDTGAVISGDTIELSLMWGWGARYTMREDGNLDGEWWSRGKRNTASSTFYKQ